jgi:Undecaprenyl-phosphate glucose phosphotransferase
MGISGHRQVEIANKIIDLVIINLCWWFAYYLRFISAIIPSDGNLFDWYLKFSALLTVLSYYYFRSEGIYSSKRLSPIFEDVFAVLKANTISFTIFIFCTYFLSSHKLSRLFILSYYVISSLSLVVFKILGRSVLRKLRANGKNSKSCILIGNTAQIQEYAEKLKVHPEFGVFVKTWVKTNEEVTKLTIQDIENENPDIIVFGLENKNYPLVNKLLLDLNTYLAEVIVLPDLSHSLVGYQVVDISGTPAILVNEPNMRSRSVIIKRMFDLILCSLGVIMISPLLFLIALAVKLSSKGPIFYSQVRMGLDGKEFKMFKFRSMTSGTANKETWTVKDDPRVTKVGKFLRKTSLDELPQLFNVILGDMSLVGPRPERPIFVHNFKHEIPTYMLRHKMKAGITGWAQINGWRGDTSIEKRIECDLYYIKNWSIWMDIWIIFMTFWKGFINKNAY